VKNHYGSTYFDEFMLTCLRGAVFFETQFSSIAEFNVPLDNYKHVIVCFGDSLHSQYLVCS